MNLQAFPHEIYRHILQYITDRTDLCALARTSKALQPEAERLIYKKLVIETEKESIERCSLIVKRPVLASYIHELTIGSSGFTTMDSGFHSMSRAISLMDHLTALNIEAEILGNPNFRTFNRCNFKLQKLYLAQYRISDGLVEFIESQLQIVDLDIRLRISLPVADGVLPNLKFIAAEADIVLPLIRTRPVTHLQLRGIVSFPSILESVQSSRVPIISLGVISRPLFSIDELRQLAEHVPSLRYVTVAFAPPESATAIATMSRFMDLEVVLICCAEAGQLKWEDSQRDFLLDMQRALRSIRCVNFCFPLASPSYRWDPVNGRWSRNSRSDWWNLWREV